MGIWFLGLERILLAFMVGGGVIIATCVRPFILQSLKISNSDVLYTVENISISSWNRYNRIALGITISLLVIQGIRMSTGMALSHWHMIATLSILIALARKLAVDKKLKNRLDYESSQVVGNMEQQAGHREVELLSKFILLVASVLLVWVSFM